jgi:adenosylmethionine-8-amino-7-oxononanoate aminotransferase
MSGAPNGLDTLPQALKAKGHHIHLDDGRVILDACGGAGVACIGYGNQEVIDAVTRQLRDVPYVCWAFHESQSRLQLHDWLVASTDGEMSKAYICSSGTWPPSAFEPCC